MEHTILERNQRAMTDLWALEDIYPTEEAWEQDLQVLKELTAKLPAYAGTFTQSAAQLLELLQLDDRLSVLLDSLVNYAQRRSDEDTRIGKYQEMVSRVTSAWVAAASASAFVTPELLELDDETLESYYAQCPELELYRRHMFNIRRKKDHILSKAEERLLAAAGEMAGAPDQIYSMLADADLTFPEVADESGAMRPLTQGTYISYMESPDRTLRKNAFQTLYKTFGSMKNTCAATLASQVKQLQFFADARRYGSALEASLDGTNVPTEVYHNLIATVHQHMDKMHRYVRLRKKLLGLDELHMYDLYTPLVADVDQKTPFDQAKQTVYDALAPMGDDYRKILQEGFDNRWIDVYENPGKRSGAYSAGARVHPFVLLNYSGTLDSQFTLAHEMGHAIHSYLSNKHQPVVYSDYVIFVAEVASTCNEALLMEHLLAKTTDRQQRAYLINHFLDQFKGTLYRQTMFAEFELLMGQMNQRGEGLTAESLCREYKKLNELYYGPDVISDDEIAMEWARIPHFYYDYYVFQYATGYAAAIALSQRIIQEGKPAVDDYVNFLSGGCSQDPIDLLKMAGVDMSSPAPIEAALELFGRLLDEMEELMEDA